jgi:hypothetical protein
MFVLTLALYNLEEVFLHSNKQSWFFLTILISHDYCLKFLQLCCFATSSLATD